MAKKEVTQIRCSELEKNKWRDAATSQGLELSAWMRLVLNREAAAKPAQEQSSFFTDEPDDWADH